MIIRLLKEPKKTILIPIQLYYTHLAMQEHEEESKVSVFDCKGALVLPSESKLMMNKKI